MTRGTKKVNRTVKILTDPNPLFVSLVDHGANQTPFRSVKVADLAELAKKKEAMKDKEPEQVTKTDSADTEINKIVFQGDAWKDEESVAKYLTSKGYSNFSVDKVEESFVVNAIAEEAFESIAPIKGADEGVTMFVGKLIPSKKGDVNITIRNVDNPGYKKTTQDMVAEGNAIPGDNSQASAYAGTGFSTNTGPKGGITQMIKEDEKVEVTARTRTREADESKAITTKDDLKEAVAQYGRAENKVMRKREILKRARALDALDVVPESWRTTKFDMHSLSLKDMMEYLDACSNGLPVGFWQVEDAFIGALRDVISKGNFDEISALTSEYGNVLKSLASVMKSDAKEQDAVIEKYLVAVAKMEVPSSDVTKTQSDEPSTEVIETAIAKVETPLKKEEMESLLQSLKNDLMGGLKDEVTKVAHRVTQLERIRQTRKSTITDGVTTNDKEHNDEMPISRGTANLLGLPVQKAERTIKRVM